MTCIVALKTEEGVWLGCDSQATKGGHRTVLEGSKMFENGGVTFAWCGSIRDMNVVKRKLSLPHLHPDQDVDAFMEVSVPEAIRACLKEHGATTVEDGKDYHDSGCLMAFRGRVWHMDGGFGVTASSGAFTAAGSGSDYAYGSLFATDGMEPLDRVKRAVEAACEFDTGCCAPIRVGKAA